MNIIDHGSWEPYKPAKFPESAPANALFVIRKSDHVDWYDYVNSGENFGADTVKFSAMEHDPAIGYAIGPAVYDATLIFPSNQVVGEITDYTGSDPQADFGGKIYDPEAGTITDPPVQPPPGPSAADEAARANRRLDDGVTAAVEALPPSGLKGMTPPPGSWPSCSIYSTVTQAIVANTPTKIQFDTAEFDVTGAFDLDNNRFKPDVAGYYAINCGCGVEAGAVQNYTSIYKNGVEYRRSTTSSEGGNTRLSTLVYLNGTTDYAEGFVRVNKGFSTIPGGILTSFSASLVQAELTPYATQQRVNEVAAATRAMLEAHAEIE